MAYTYTNPNMKKTKRGKSQYLGGGSGDTVRDGYGQVGILPAKQPKKQGNNQISQPY